MQKTEILRKTPDGFKPASQLNDGPEWFADIHRRMRASASGLVSEVVILSPSRAQALLEANEHNRKVSESTVATYAQDIIDGRWTFNGEPVIVSDTGELNDGQHRCAAVVAAGRAIEVLLVVGVSRASRTTTDTGKSRSVGDFLDMHGFAAGNTVAACASVLNAIEKKQVAQSTRHNGDVYTHINRPTKAYIFSFAKANMKDISRALKEVSPANSLKVGTHSRTAGILAAIARASHDWEDAIKFVTSVVDGENLKSGSPSYILRDRLLAEKQNKALSPGKNIELFLKGWNAYRSGQHISRIVLTKSIPTIEV
jgi:hypothetical protein